MRADDWEYDPDIIEANKQTLAYQQARLSDAIADVRNGIAAVRSVMHVNQVLRMGRLRLWWHIVTGHRK